MVGELDAVSDEEDDELEENEGVGGGLGTLGTRGLGFSSLSQRLPSSPLGSTGSAFWPSGLGAMSLDLGLLLKLLTRFEREEASMRPWNRCDDEHSSVTPENLRESPMLCSEIVLLSSSISTTISLILFSFCFDPSF